MRGNSVSSSELGLYQHPQLCPLWHPSASWPPNSVLTVFGAKLGPEDAMRNSAWRAHSTQRAVTRMVQSLNSEEATSTSTAVREESHRAQTFETLPLPLPHPEFYSVLEEIEESCCFSQLC
uniref:Uncharacterized protein n=1 Tax=Molossus molossus TaxID=27622 RepID=A0A7J8ER31_MOLMO|nr:hypothetical protein HJG59_008683 [Molossus molossus]